MKANLFRLRGIFALVCAAGAFATLALAHNKLMKTEPATGAALKTPPAHIALWFEEKPDLATTKIAVRGSAGAVALGTPHESANNSVVADFKATLADGPYTVTWQTAGDDGHMSKGDFTFTVRH